MTAIMNVADMKNPETGKTYRQENLEKQHTIPLGTLVELLPFSLPMEDDYNKRTGLRLFVVKHERDCDGTPLYGVSYLTLEEIANDDKLFKDSTLTLRVDGHELAVRGDLFTKSYKGGYTEKSLRVINKQQLYEGYRESLPHLHDDD